MTTTSRKKQQWHGRSRGGGVGIRCFEWLIRHVGTRGAYLLLYLVVPYFVLFAPTSTRSVWYFSRHVRHLGLLSSVVAVFRTFFVFGQCIIDRMAVCQVGADNLFAYDTENFEEVYNTMAQEKPCIVISAHVGQWEVGSPFFANLNRKMNVTLFEGESKAVQAVLNEAEADKRFDYILLGSDSLASVMQIKAALDRNEIVCFMADRYMTGSQTRRVRFLGHEVDMTITPFRIAKTLSVPITLYFIVRQNNSTYKIIFHNIDISKCCTPQEMQDAYVFALEDVVRRYPHQWFNLYNYFQYKN